MGVNMEVKLVYGVKVTGEDTAALLDEDDNWIAENNGLDIVDDCYCGEWTIVGKVIQASQDYRYDEQNFMWDINELKPSKEYKKQIKEKLKKSGITQKPSLICLTHYT